MALPWAHPALALGHNQAHEWKRQEDAWAPRHLGCLFIFYFFLCRHKGMTKAYACICKAMGVMPWLCCLGKSSNEALLRVRHGLGARHVTKASLTQEGLAASISCWWCMAQTTRHVDVLQDLGKKGVIQ